MCHRQTRGLFGKQAYVVENNPTSSYLFGKQACVLGNLFISFDIARGGSPSLGFSATGQNWAAPQRYSLGSSSGSLPPLPRLCALARWPVGPLARPCARPLARWPVGLVVCPVVGPMARSCARSLARWPVLSSREISSYHACVAIRISIVVRNHFGSSCPLALEDLQLPLVAVAPCCRLLVAGPLMPCPSVRMWKSPRCVVLTGDKYASRADLREGL